MNRQRILSGVILTILAVFAYVLFEWLFLITQGGFMVSLGTTAKFAALTFSALILLVAALAPLSGLIAVELVVSGRNDTSRSYLPGALPAAGILTGFALLLIDNFTYTVLGIGIVTAGPLSRFFYLPLIVFLLIYFARSLAGARRRWAESGVPAWLIVLPVMLVSLSVGVTVTRAWTAGSSSVDTAAELRLVPRKPWNILLVTIDGVESRRMSAYGYARKTTPFLERFKERAWFFENAFSNAGRTSGSLTSILNAKPPSVTKVIFPPHILTGNDSFEHLPGILRRAGYRAFQFSVRYYADGPDLNMRGAFDYANGRQVRDRAFGMLTRRFSEERYFSERLLERLSERVLYVAGIRPVVNHFRLIQLPTSIYGEQSDRQRVDRAVAAAAATGAPFFIHVHLMGTHCCGFRIRQPVFSARENPTRVDLADDALRQVDGEIERLLLRLSETEGDRSTIVIIASDHSANWGTDTRVPLMIHLPDGSGPQVVTRNVQLLDIAPTILDVIGLARPRWMLGQSLFRDGSQPLFIESVTEIEKEVVDADWERISRLRDPAPPSYGLSAVGAVVCDKWLQINLRSGAVSTGLVDGHTAPCSPEGLPGPNSVGLELLLRFRARGFALPLDRSDAQTKYRAISSRASWPERPLGDRGGGP